MCKKDETSSLACVKMSSWSREHSSLLLETNYSEFTNVAAFMLTIFFTITSFSCTFPSLLLILAGIQNDEEIHKSSLLAHAQTHKH